MIFAELILFLRSTNFALDVPMYAGGYPKAKALAQFVNSKTFYPLEKTKAVKKSIDFLTAFFTVLFFA